MTARFVSTVLKAASVAAVPLAMLAASVPASAQGAGQRTLFEWRGNVDQEVRVQMQGGRTAVIGMGPRESIGYGNARAMSSVPSTNGYVSVQMLEGRGVADVVQQPRAQNGYTTVVRIRDTQSGAGQYDVAAYWQPTGNYGYGNTGVYNDGQYNNGQYNNGRYNDGRYNDGRYDDGRYGNGQYGQYGQYPAPVIVQRPVYGSRGDDGKALPVPQRGNAYPSRDAGRYPSTVVPGFPNPNAPRGKALPGSAQTRGEQAPPVVYRPAPSGQKGKTLPGTSQQAQQNQQNQQNYGHHRGH